MGAWLGVINFSDNRVDFDDWRFPLGTNDAAFSSFWYFIDGRIRPTPKDAAHEICAAGVPMSAMPGLSRLWRLDGDGGSRAISTRWGTPTSSRFASARTTSS